MAAVRARACSRAVPVFEGVIRRQRDPAVAEGAREGLGLCALVEGQRLVAAGKPAEAEDWFRRATAPGAPAEVVRDRKSTRLNSSHLVISYAVFCLKKKKN